MEVKNRSTIQSALAALLLLTAALATAQQPVATKPLLPTGQETFSLPFEAGEEVRYEVNWKPLKNLLPFSIRAGELRLSVEPALYKDKEAFKIAAWVTSDGLLASLFNLKVTDYYESWIDGRDLRSHRFLYQRRQNNRKRDLEVLFDYERDQTFIRETDVASAPPRQVRNETRPGIPAPLVDTLSVFYAARWRVFQPGEQYQMHLSDNGRIKEVGLKIEKAEKVKIGMGRFESVRIRAQGDIFKGGGEFRVWYTRDRLRLPVKFEADVKIGKVYGELVQLQTPRLTRQRIRVR